MAKTTTITREYDHEGRVVKETIVESGEANAMDRLPAYPGVGSVPRVYPSINTSPPGEWPKYTVNN